MTCSIGIPTEYSPMGGAPMEERDRFRSGTGVGDQARDWSETTETARQGFETAKQGVRDYAAETKQYVQGAVDQTREYLEDTVQQARDKVTQARDKVARYRDGGFEKVRDDVTSYTREQPMTALLIAAGAGVILGWLSAAGRR